MSKTIDLEQIPVIKELVEAAIDEKTTPLEDEIEDIKKNGDRVHQFLLYDWDDTLIGVVAVPMGYDPRPYINKYVKVNLIHPQLQNNTNYSSRERTDNYRGEYPHTGPDENDPLRTGGADTVEDGGDYQLTNHLEYCFMGKDLDPDYPYVSGWTEVTPENMADTFTALATQNDGTVSATEFGPAPTEEGATAPRIAQFDWTDIASITTPTITRLKACYKLGVNANGGFYQLSPRIETRFLTSPVITTYRIGIFIKFLRVNANGYGIFRPSAPTLRYSMVFNDDTSTMLRCDPANRDVLLCELDIQANNITKVIYRLVKTGTLSLIGGTHLSDEYELDIPSVVRELRYRQFQEQIYNITNGTGTAFVSTVSDFNNWGFRFLNGVVYSAAAQVNQTKAFIKKFITAGIAAGQTDAYSYTYYQYQYAIMTKGTGSGNDDIVYLTPEDAETYCKANYEWCQPQEETTE